MQPPPEPLWDDPGLGHREAKATLSPMMRLFSSGHHSVHPSSCTPSALLPALSIPPSTTFDLLQKSGISHITNSALSDTQWLQASLPVRDGGLGGSVVSCFAGTFCLPGISCEHSGDLQNLISLQVAVPPNDSCPRCCPRHVWFSLAQHPVSPASSFTETGLMGQASHHC